MNSEYVDSLGLEELTGTKASTWRYWEIPGAANRPEGLPASFKLGRRRVWRRDAVLAWLAAQEAATDRDATGNAVTASPHGP